MASEPLATESSKAQESIRLNQLADTLYRHSIQHFEAHDTEGIVDHTTQDSNSNSISNFSLLLGVRKVGVPARIWMPLCGTYSPISGLASGNFVHEFNGLKFILPDDVEWVAQELTKAVNNNGNLVTSEKQALREVIAELTFMDREEDVTKTVAGVDYVVSVVVTLDVGLVRLTYVRS